jgi:hypothetical protein
VEDGSEFRRGKITMLRSQGAPVAVNVGDATNVLAIEPLLGNTMRIGTRKALLVLREVERMARESAEGQAIELGWIAGGQFDLGDRDYVRMAYKKTCWYTVIAPLRIGVICGAPAGSLAPLEDDLTQLIELGFLAGIAFQIPRPSEPRRRESLWQRVATWEASAPSCCCICAPWRVDRARAGPPHPPKPKAHRGYRPARVRAMTSAGSVRASTGDRLLASGARSGRSRTAVFSG